MLFIGSLEKNVEDAIKTWEMEVTHKMDPKEWKTVDIKSFSLECNGIKTCEDANMMRECGSYNALLAGCPSFRDCKKSLFTALYNLHGDVTI